MEIIEFLSFMMINRTSEFRNLPNLHCSHLKNRFIATINDLWSRFCMNLAELMEINQGFFRIQIRTIETIHN